MKIRLRFAVLSAFQLMTFVAAPFAAAAPLCSLWSGKSSIDTYKIENYQPVSEVCTTIDGKMVLATRRFKASPSATQSASLITRSYLSKNSFVLAVDPQTANTSIINDDCLACSGATQTTLNMLPFYQALEKYTSTPFPINDDGLTHSIRPLDGTIVSVDMCPAHRLGFEAHFFQTLVDRSFSTHEATPVAISMTGKWAERHAAEFQWLKKQNAEHTLDITWVNHTYSHPYQPHVPERANFLLDSRVDFTAEVLNQEKFMIQNGELPSVFFRFPGLVSDQALVEKLKSYFLIPVGADAWLALGEKAKPGSIILVHGNLNEPQGIRLFENLYDKLWPKMNLFSLNQALQ